MFLFLERKRDFKLNKEKENGFEEEVYLLFCRFVIILKIVFRVICWGRIRDKSVGGVVSELGG